MYVLIAYLLGVLSCVRHKNGNSANADTHANRSNNQALPDGPLSVVCIPPAPTNEESTEQKKSKRRKTIKFWAEIVGLIVLTIYTATTIALWLAAKEANKQVRTQWSAEHRPWIGSGEIEVRQPSFVFYPNNPPMMKTQFNFTIEVPIKNFGNSPAFHVATIITGTLTEQIAGPPTLEERMVYACKGADSNAKNIGGVLFPNNIETRVEQPTALGSSISQVDKIHRVWLTICTAYSEGTNGENIRHTKIWFASWPINGEPHEMRDPSQPGIVYYSFPSTRWSVIKMEAD